MGQVACRSSVSFLYSRRPVRNYYQRRVRLHIHKLVDQKPLPVPRHGIGRIPGHSNPGAELEERDRRAHLEALSAAHLRRHQLPVSRVVEQFPPISPPAWTAATAVRDLTLAAASGEALHPDLIPARFIGGIGQPPP